MVFKTFIYIEFDATKLLFFKNYPLEPILICKKPVI